MREQLGQELLFYLLFLLADEHEAQGKVSTRLGMTWISHCNWLKEHLKGPLPAMLFPLSHNVVSVIFDS